MGLITVEKISLDFYNKNLITVNAKQYDDESRYIEVACTEYGKKITLSSNSETVFVECKKPDGKEVFNKCTITKDGSVLIELTEQMLAAIGKCEVDLMIVSNDESKIANITDAESLYSVNPTILTTMSFSINVLPAMIKYSAIASTDEFNGITDILKEISDIAIKEAERQENELNRISLDAERGNKIDAALQACNEATVNANKVAEHLNDVETALSNCTASTSDAISAAERAENAANHIIQQTNTRPPSVFYSAIDGSKYLFQIKKSDINIPDGDISPITGDIIITTNNYWYGIVGENIDYLYVRHLGETSSSITGDITRGTHIKIASCNGYISTLYIEENNVDDFSTGAIGDLILCNNGALFYITQYESHLFHVAYLATISTNEESRGYTILYSTYVGGSGTTQIINGAITTNNYMTGDLVVDPSSNLFIVNGVSGTLLNVTYLTTL